MVVGLDCCVVPARELAERFATGLSDAWDTGRDGELLWETAARAAGLDGYHVRVVRVPGLAFLVYETWVVEQGDAGWSVRDWHGEDDVLYDSAVELEALPEDEDFDDA